ncbi:hypothetical protein [Thioclava sp. GXIMD2076]|uniref:hypothetical protein n=1 Tax=Thioclava sp. GXIMD2076 TaxID=3131931 RepID=UPI0030D1C805
MATYKGKIVTALAVWNADAHEAPSDAGCAHYGWISVKGATLGQLADLEAIALGAGACLGREDELDLCFQLEGSDEWFDAHRDFNSPDWSDE